MTSTRVFVLAGVLLSASVAHAAPDAGDLTAARALYHEGFELAQKGDHQEAVVKLRAARDLVRTPIILLALAKSELALGQLVEAREAALEASRVPRQPAETFKSDEARAEAAELAKKLDVRIPRPRMLSAEEKIELKPKAEFYAVRKESPLVAAGFAVGGVALFSGMITGLVTIGKKATLNCTGMACPPKEWDALDSARDWGNVTTGMFIVAGAGLVTGITGLVLTKRVWVKKSGFTVRPWASGMGAGVSGSFE